MTLPQVIFLCAGIWFLIATGMAIAAYRESNRLKKKISARKGKVQASKVKPEPESDEIDWRDLGIQYSEFPYVKLR